MLVEEEDYASLRESIEAHDKFDHMALAVKLEKHELLEFRRIAALLYKQNGRFAESVRISKQDKMLKDAIDTAADSKDGEVVEELLKFFVEVGDQEAFCATTYSCYHLVRPDVILELAWRNQLTDFAMPFLIQYMSQLHDKVKALEEKTADKAPDGDAAGAAGGATAFMSPPGGYMLENAAFTPAMQQQMQQQQMMMMQQQQQQQPNGFPMQQQQQFMQPPQ